MTRPATAALTEPSTSTAPHPSRRRGRRRGLSGAAIAIWAVIGGLGILFGVFAVAIALQAATFDVMRWLLALAIEAPLAGGIIALIRYSRVLTRTTAAGEAASSALANSVGRERGDIVGHSFMEFVPTDRLASAHGYLDDRLRGFRATELYEATFSTAKGKRVHVQLRSQVVRPADADSYVVYIVRDVTDQREAQRQLLESERWASMGRLASFVAHEINTPLTNISLLTASIARRVSDAEVQERLKKIAAQGRIAASITAELLKFARPGAINPVETNLTDLVREAVEQAEAFRKPGVEVRTELGSEPVVCTVDPLRIHEVLVNLLKNAFEATANGRIRVRLEDRGPSVAVSVSDTGTGIQPEVQQRLFEAFYTTKKKGEGTGLGLAISRNFVASHGGDITVTSEVGKGSTFTVFLPKQPVSVTTPA